MKHGEGAHVLAVLEPRARGRQRPPRVPAEVRLRGPDAGGDPEGPGVFPARRAAGRPEFSTFQYTKSGHPGLYLNILTNKCTEMSRQSSNPLAGDPGCGEGGRAGPGVRGLGRGAGGI